MTVCPYCERELTAEKAAIEAVSAQATPVQTERHSRKNVVLILLTVALLASLGGIGALVFAIRTWQARNSDLDARLVQVTSEREAVKANLYDLQNSYASLKSQVGRLMCLYVISPSQMNSVSTNQALVEPITRVVDAEYAISSINTGYDLTWNNSKTAIFTVENSNRATVKVVASWGSSSNKLEAIYDIGQGCFYYLP